MFFFLSKAVVVIIVWIDCCTSSIKLDSRCAARHLLIHTFQQLNKLCVVQFTRKLSSLCHLTNHPFDHLSLFRFADFQRIHWKNGRNQKIMNWLLADAFLSSLTSSSCILIHDLAQNWVFYIFLLTSAILLGLLLFGRILAAAAATL